MNTTTPQVRATDIPRWAINDIVPSPFQSRRDFNEGKLQEMANSIVEHDIIQPITLRRVTPTGPLELVCGERRLRAGKLAGLETVPYILRDLTDAQAENIVLIENIQREDLMPSEEATHYDRLLKIRDAEGKLLHTRETVAKLASKTLNYIDDHLKLLVCPVTLQDAVDKGEVALSVAMVVGRIPDAKLRTAAAVKVMTPDYQQVPMNFTQAREMVRAEFMVSLAGVPWELDDASLLPVKSEDVNGTQVRCFGGACVDCPFQSSNIEGANVTKTEGGRTSSKRQAGGASGKLCTLPKCHAAKLDAVCRGQKVKALEKGLKVLDDKDAAKQFHPSKNETANGAKYVWLDAKPADHEVGWQLAYHNTGKIWRTLLKGSEVPVVMARNPHTGLLVEMAPVKEAKPVGEKALRQKKDPEKEKEKTPAELKEDEDARNARKAELRQQKIDAITLPEALTEIRSSIERKGADALLLEKLCDMALQRAGSDGSKFLADVLGIEREKKAGGYGLDKPIKQKMAEICEDRVPAWHGMLSLVLMAWELSYHGLKAEGFKAMLGVCGIKLTDIERRAKALFEGQEKGKAKDKGKVAPAKAGRNSTDDSNWTADAVADTTAAADKLAKGSAWERLLALDVPAGEPNANGVFTSPVRLRVVGNNKCAVTLLLACNAAGEFAASTEYFEKVTSQQNGGGSHPWALDLMPTRVQAVCHALNEVCQHLANQKGYAGIMPELLALRDQALEHLKGGLKAAADHSSLKVGAAKAAAAGQVDPHQGAKHYSFVELQYGSDAKLPEMIEALLRHDVEFSEANVNGVFEGRTRFVCHLSKDVWFVIELARCASEGAECWCYGGAYKCGKRGDGALPVIRGHMDREDAVQQAAMLLLEKLDAKADPKSCEFAREAALKMLNAIYEAALPEATRDLLGLVKGADLPHEKGSGSSAMEQGTGIQSSKLGRPGMFTKEDITAGAVLLMNETITITELIGPKPNRKENEGAYKTWNSVRMKLLRNAGLAV